MDNTILVPIMKMRQTYFWNGRRVKISRAVGSPKEVSKYIVFDIKLGHCLPEPVSALDLQGCRTKQQSANAFLARMRNT